MMKWSKVPNLHIQAKHYNYCHVYPADSSSGHSKIQIYSDKTFMMWLLPTLVASSPVMPSHIRSHAEVISNNWQFSEYAAKFHTSCLHRPRSPFEPTPSHPHPPTITTTSVWFLHFLFNSMHVFPVHCNSWFILWYNLIITLTLQ